MKKVLLVSSLLQQNNNETKVQQVIQERTQQQEVGSEIEIVSDRRLENENQYKSLRISARRFTLPYSRVSNNVTLTRLFDAFKANLRLSGAEILLCQESHKDLNDVNDIHSHALAESCLNKKFNIRNANLLDVTIDNETYKGHHKTGVDVAETIDDTTKEDNVTSTNDTFFQRLLAKYDSSLECKRVDLIASGQFTASQAISFLKTNPRQSVGNITNVTKAYDTSKRI